MHVRDPAGYAILPSMLSIQIQIATQHFLIICLLPRLFIMYVPVLQKSGTQESENNAHESDDHG